MSLTVHPVASMGAEDVVVSPDGVVHTGTEDGAIWALHPAADGCAATLTAPSPWS